MILNAGAAVVSGGTSSEILNAGLEYVRSKSEKNVDKVGYTHIRLSTVEER